MVSGKIKDVKDKKVEITTEEKIDFSHIEKKWQTAWEKKKAFEVKDSGKNKCYVLEMYPYPSASGLHIGHAFNYTLGDIYARFKRMQGFNVLHPIGFDSFGLPAENAAMKAKSHPKIFTEKAIANFIVQQKALGLSYDWSRMVESHKPDYYKWDQWIFLKMFEKGLAYKKNASVNWCPSCKTVLANEQAQGGICERCKSDVEIKHLDQWFFKITDYADQLYEGTYKLTNWPDRIKAMQRNWIGKSHGVEIGFDINGKKWQIFTTRPDTIYGVTFMVVSAQHAKLMELVTKEQKKEVEAFLKKIKSTSEKDALDLEKEGVFTGSYAINPVTGDKVPVYAGNFVVADYGSGMVMAVPAHDSRDFDFAKKYNIPVKVVITSEKNKVIAIKDSLNSEFYKKVQKIGNVSENDGLIIISTDKVDEVLDIAKNSFVGSLWYVHSEGKVKKILFHSDKENKIFDWSNSKECKSAKEYGLKIGIKKEQLNFDDLREAYVDEGILINSGEFNGIASKEAIDKISLFLEKKKIGKKVVNYKLRDWLISRQRFWGTPIPIIYCDKCGAVAVPEKDLPVKLPEDISFSNERNPLIDYKPFTETKCPKCKGKARRETDTMDTFVNSSWYFLRYCDSGNDKVIFDKKKVEYWMPMDKYIGGAEHACMHLIYCRFYTKFLRDLGLLKIDEPTLNLFNQGMVHGPDGVVMSKTRGNVVDPLDMIEKYSSDTLRIFLVSMASPDKDSAWSPTGIESMHKFVRKVYSSLASMKIGKSSARVEHKISKAIKEVSELIENWQYNIAVIKLRELFDSFEEQASKSDVLSVVSLISPFCPHIAEELWEKIGGKGFVSLAEWPKADESKIDMKLEEAEKNVDKIVSDVLNVMKIVKEKEGKECEKVYLYVIPNELSNYNSDVLGKRIGKEVKVYAVNDKNKYDPQGKAGKAKPGKPGIFLE